MFSCANEKHKNTYKVDARSSERSNGCACDRKRLKGASDASLHCTLFWLRRFPTLIGLCWRRPTTSTIPRWLHLALPLPFHLHSPFTIKKTHELFLWNGPRPKLRLWAYYISRPVSIPVFKIWSGPSSGFLIYFGRGHYFMMIIMVIHNKGW